MKSPAAHWNPSACFALTGLLLIAPLWLVLTAGNATAQTQTANVSGAGSTPSPSDWPDFHRDNTVRWNPNETVLSPSSVGGLKLKWTFATGSSHYVYEDSSPVAVNGVVYFASINGNVYAVDARTGAQLWSFLSTSIIYSTPTVANGVVYVGSYGNLYALNASSGAKLWSYGTGTGVPWTPEVANGMVYFGAGNNVYALNAGTGVFLWDFVTGAAVETEPAVVNGVVYVNSGDSHVYALNASTGSMLWSYATANAVQSSPAVANGVVYVGSFDANLYALNASTGAKLWSFLTNEAIASTPAVANGIVYVGSDDGTLYALNATSGARVWSFFAGTFHRVQTSPAVANGVVYFGTDDGNQYALNASTGAKLWSYATGDNFIGPSPTVVDGVLYGGSGVHYYAFGLGGADLSLRATASPSPVVSGQLLTYTFPVWNQGPVGADHEVLTTQVPAGTTFDYVRLSGTPGVGTCTHPAYGGTGAIVCQENSIMAVNTAWTVRLTVKVTAPPGTVISESATATEATSDPNSANNTAAVSVTVQ